MRKRGRTIAPNEVQSGHMFGQLELKLHADLTRGPKGPLATKGRLAERSGATIYGNCGMILYGCVYFEMYSHFLSKMSIEKEKNG